METKSYDWQMLCNSKSCLFVGSWLSLWAGFLNALGAFSLLYLRTTHLTGPATDQAIYFLTNKSMFILVTIVIVSFVCGAFCAARMSKRLTFTKNLQIPGLLMTIALGMSMLGLTVSGPDSLEIQRYILAVILPLCAGWQNAISSKSRIGRTTHHTGNLTDFALAMAEGNWLMALNLFSKYFMFMLGGFAGYLGAQTNPTVALAVLCAGYTLTVYYYHQKDLAWQLDITEIMQPEVIFGNTVWESYDRR